MSKRRQSLSNTELTHHFLDLDHLDLAYNFIIENDRTLLGRERECGVSLRSLLIPLLQSQWSYALKKQEKVAVMSLQADLKDCQTIADDQNFKLFFPQIEVIASYALKLKCYERGQYIVSIVNVRNSQIREYSRHRQIYYVYLSVLFARVAGWKQVIVSTKTPFAFFRLNSEIFREFKGGGDKHYVMVLDTETVTLNPFPFQEFTPKL